MATIFLALKIWLAILPLAFVNGALRVFILNRLIGERAGHVASTFLLSAGAFFVVAFFIKRAQHILALKQLLLLGFSLVVLTVAFEFALGLLGGKTWNEMLADYNVFKGRIWPLVLLVEFLGPLIIGKNGH